MRLTFKNVLLFRVLIKIVHIFSCERRKEKEIQMAKAIF